MGGLDPGCLDVGVIADDLDVGVVVVSGTDAGNIQAWVV